MINIEHFFKYWIVVLNIDKYDIIDSVRDDFFQKYLSLLIIFDDFLSKFIKI